MKVDTEKLYQKMTSKEKAALYCRSDDFEERGKIQAAVPWYDYRAMDYDFTFQVHCINATSHYAIAEYWRTLSKFEAWSGDRLANSLVTRKEPSKWDAETRMCIAQLSRMKALELTLDKYGLDYVLREAGATMFADDFAEVSEIELNPAYIETAKLNFCEFFENSLDYVSRKEGKAYFNSLVDGTYKGRSPIAGISGEENAELDIEDVARLKEQ